jgi:hypothetical protein
METRKSVMVRPCLSTSLWRVTGALSSRNEMEVRIDIAKAVSPMKALESFIASSSLAQQTG